MKKNLFKVILLIFFNINKIIKADYVTFELKTYTNISDYSDEYENFFYENLYNILYSEIPLGPNKEKIIMEIKAENFLFSIFNYNCEVPPVDNSKNANYSTDFANSTILRQFIFPIYQEYNASILENTIYIKTNKGEKNTKINYLFSPRNDFEKIKYLILRPYTCFQLGFEVLFKPNIDIDSINDYALNLIIQFKRANITSSYKWFIEYNYNNNNKADIKLVLGGSPEEYNPKKYSEENSKIVLSKIRLDGYIYWDIDVDKIYLKNNNSTELYLDPEINMYLTCSLEVSLGVIFGTSGYKNYIEENFFSSLRNEKKCFRSNPLILDKYMVYYCRKDIKEFLKSNFPSIILYHRIFNKTFELNYDDLFVEKGEYIYFLIFFDKYKYEMWRFGKPFLRKYFFSYDLDKRTITFYHNIGNINDNDHVLSENDGVSNIVLIIIIILLDLIFVSIGFFIGKYIYSSNKRKKGTELCESDENYNYENINGV